MTQHDEVQSVRQAQEDEIEQLADIWYQGWQDAHTAILPEDLSRLRTWESFKERLRASLHAVRVVGPINNPVGFCMTNGTGAADEQAVQVVSSW